jgi:hypothetical protein
MELDPDGVPARDSSDRAISMSVQGVELTSDHTILHLAVRNWTTDRTGSLKSPAGAYITDDRNRPYNFQAEGLHGQAPFTSNGEVRPRVTELLELSFPRIQDTSFLVLTHPQFAPITLYQFQRPPASVFFCREFTGILTDLVVKMDISCDGNRVGDVSIGKRVNTSLRAGKHFCRASAHLVVDTESDPLEINLHPGEDYYIRTRSQNVWSGRPDLKPVATEAECPKGE